MPTLYRLDPALRFALREIGLSPENVLRRACLPGDLLAREAPQVSSEDFFRFWQAIGDEAGTVSAAINLGRIGAIEGFSPVLMAALASPNLIVAAQRIAQYKNLFAPLAMDVEVKLSHVRIASRGKGFALPMPLAVTELVFWTTFIRRATREPISPLKATLPDFLENAHLVEDALGIRLTRANETSISFNTSDANRPFLTADAEAWAYYKPVLDKRLSALEQDASMADRIHATLVELLPSGRTSLDAVASSLAFSPRSLQRMLRQEGTTFNAILASTRERLAKHYLCSPGVTKAEVAFLLGYDDPNSFFRAFRAWTGTTPERYRTNYLAD